MEYGNEDDLEEGKEQELTEQEEEEKKQMDLMIQLRNALINVHLKEVQENRMKERKK